MSSYVIVVVLFCLISTSTSHVVVILCRIMSLSSYVKLDLLRDCIAAVNDWFLLHGLSLNTEKSEILLLGTAAKLRTIGAVGQMSDVGVLINTTDFIKNLGMFLDSGLTFNKHVGNVCQSFYFHIMVLRQIRGSLSSEVANTVGCAIVGARLDYCNSILYGSSKYNISRLQHVQNTLALIVARTKKFDHITPVLRHLHWLSIQCRIEYKVAILALMIRETGQPSYLSHAIQPKEVTRNLRTSDDNSIANQDRFALNKVWLCSSDFFFRRSNSLEQTTIRSASVV